MSEVAGDGPPGVQEAHARFAGLMYLFTAFDVTGVVIVSRISGGDGFVAVAHRIAEFETLYRIGLLCGLIGTLSTLLLAIGLYVALKPVDGNLALTALLFRLAETTIGGVVVVLAFATLQMNLEASHASALDAKQFGGARGHRGSYLHVWHKRQRGLLRHWFDNLLLPLSQVGLHSSESRVLRPDRIPGLPWGVHCQPPYPGSAMTLISSRNPRTCSWASEACRSG